MSILTIIYAILIFCLLIFIHELGHLIAAKSVGVLVNEFSLGMGPKLLQFKKGETKYSLRAIPIGGYCAMEGEDEASDNPRAFSNKSFFPKALVLVAGSFMNFILAVILIAAVLFSVGTPSTTVSKVGEDSPAAAAGILPGDKIVSVDGKEINDWMDMQGAFVDSESDSTEIVVMRQGKDVKINSGLYEDESGSKKVGIMPEIERKPSNIVPSFVHGVKAVGDTGVRMVESIGWLFTGQASVKDLTGPVGIVYFVGDTIAGEEGTAVSAMATIFSLAQLTALISLNLAIVNMLPIPALDGGRVLLLIIRAFTRGKVSDETEGKIHFVGIVLLFALMAFVTFQDITRFIFRIG
jgi:regulator of sigma E protease